MRKIAHDLASPCEGVHRSVQKRARSCRIVPEYAGEAQDCAGVLRSAREYLCRDTTMRRSRTA